MIGLIDIEIHMVAVYSFAVTLTSALIGKIQDISRVKLKVKPRPVKGAISNQKDASQEVIIDFIRG